MEGLLLLALLLVFGSGDAPKKKKKNDEPAPDEPVPDGGCLEGQPVIYDGPRVYTDARPDPTLSSLERAGMLAILIKLQSDAGLAVPRKGLCTKEALGEALGLGKQTSWRRVLSTLVQNAVTGSPAARQWTSYSEPERIRISAISAALASRETEAKCVFHGDCPPGQACLLGVCVGQADEDVEDVEDEPENAETTPVTETPWVGARYQVRQGNTLLGLVGQAYGVPSGSKRLALARALSENPMNAVYRVESKSAYNKKNFPNGIFDMTPRFSGIAPDALNPKSDQYAGNNNHKYGFPFFPPE